MINFIPTQNFSQINIDSHTEAKLESFPFVLPQENNFSSQVKMLFYSLVMCVGEIE